MNQDIVDLAIVGAGPAGLAAATTAAALGLDVCLFDEQPWPGGQIYRGIDHPTALNSGDTREREAGCALLLEFRQSKADYRPGTSVWHVGPGDDGQIDLGFSSNTETSMASARFVLFATGSVERPMPIPGWTLPGVMTAGAAQSMLKSSGIRPNGPIVMAGSGPLLYLCADQLAEAGAPIKALIDTTPSGRYIKVIRDLPGALRSPAYLRRGLALLRAPARHGIPVYRDIEAVEAFGDRQLCGVRWLRRGRWQEAECTHLLLHHGVMPHINLPRMADCDMEWSPRQHCWKPVIDAWGRSSVEGCWIAGDGAGISGGAAAAGFGHIAALGIAADLGRMTVSEANRLADIHRRELAPLLALRPLLDNLYRPADAYMLPADETLVCRCEDVTAGQIRKAVSDGCHGVEAIKLYTRCGMGHCQGRMCGSTVPEVIAAASGISVPEAGLYRQRTPVKPLPLTELAKLDVVLNGPSEEIRQ